MPRGDRGGTSSGTGKRCVAANCGNTNPDGVSIHEFRSITDPYQRKRWIEFVNVKRKNWDGPSKYSVLCSDHFTLDCYPFKVRFEKTQTGIWPKHARLNKGACPSIHAPEKEPKPGSSGIQSASLPCSPPKKTRRAYAKRETTRIIAEHEEQVQSNESGSDLDICLNKNETHSDQVLLDHVPISNTGAMPFSCQVNIRRKTKSRKCQVKLHSAYSACTSVSTSTKGNILSKFGIKK